MVFLCTLPQSSEMSLFDINDSAWFKKLTLVINYLFS